jgi:tRNA threonylcarbamoyladenosine biosynthesis protein TsaE
MASFISHSPAETAALGEQWGRAAESGLVIGLARGLGIVARVHSPTFALVNIYNGGRLTLYHLDLYRLDTREQILAAGLEEYLKPEGVTVIEWAERWVGEVQSPKSKVQSPGPAVVGRPEGLRMVQIEVLSETERRIIYEDTGT